MKGVILAGGIGSRLRPLTDVVSKHLLPVYNTPVIYYSIYMLRDLGVRDITIVLSKERTGLTEEALGDGAKFGVDLTYRIQEYKDGKQTGMAKAVECVKNLIKERFVVVAGDNIFYLEEEDRKNVLKILEGKENPKSAGIFLKEMDNPEGLGVPVFKDKKIIMIEEKPKEPKSKYGQTGMYVYPPDVFDVIKDLAPSARGEYEITDINNNYLKRGLLDYAIIKGGWTDVGTFESLYTAQKLAREIHLKGNPAK